MPLHPVSAPRLAALLLATSVVLSPAPRAVAGEYPPAIRSGAWAFELDKDMGGDDFAANEISLKRHTGSSTALRLSVGIRYDGKSGPGERSTFPPLVTSGTTRSTFSHQYTLRLDWVRVFGVSERFDAQLGIGPLASFIRQSDGDAAATGNYSNVSTRENLFGGEANLGIEWFFMNRISLGGRAGLFAVTGTRRVQYRYGTTTSAYRETSETDVLRFLTDPARIALTVYL